MKKIIFIFISVLFVLFVTITLLKSPSSPVNSESDDSEKMLVEKEKIQRFWVNYRQATEHRIAGRKKKAAVDYQRALMLNDQHEDALYYLGNIYLDLGDIEGAEKVWKRLVQINPNSARTYFQLGDLYLIIEQNTLFNIQLAEVEFQRALEINKEETAPLLRLGQIALIHSNLSDARSLFEAVTASNFKSVEAYFLDGYIAWKKGDKQKALNLLVQAAEASRPVEPTHGVLGEGDTKSGNAHGLPERSKHQPLFRN